MIPTSIDTEPNTRHPWRWAACSITEFGHVGSKRHMARKGALTTICGHSATHPEIWRSNTTKPACTTCAQEADRLLASNPTPAKKPSKAPSKARTFTSAATPEES